MTPKEIVHELDKHIIGQDEAKRAVAIALRNRWRRMQLDDEMQQEVTPKNILMIGPTGVGKTEVSRRLAKLANAPFIKVEATKFTEVGYVGKDIESIIRELMAIAFKMERDRAVDEIKPKAEVAAEERVLDILLPPVVGDQSVEEELSLGTTSLPESKTRTKFRTMLREGKLDEREIELAIRSHSIGVEIMGPPGMEEMTSQLQSMMQNLGGSKEKQKRKVTVATALKLLVDEEAANLLDEEKVKEHAVTNVEQSGIVFIDEIDKVVRRSDGGGSGGEVSREGVQRDLLPLIEGSSVSTKYGVVKTDHILFIASGAFHLSKPADLIPELQGRLPIRVELNALGTKEFVRILTEPDASLTEQYTALMGTEGVTLKFAKTGVKRIAELACQVNEQTENIGARRLHTMLERLLENISFEASEMDDKKITIDTAYVNKQLDELAQDEDLSRYIL